jgi:hypothetical protein
LRTAFEAPTLERFAHALERALLLAAGELPDDPVPAGPPGT